MSTATTLGDSTAKVAATLRSQYQAAVDVAIKAQKDLPAQCRDIEARTGALQAENARRAAAGVRVNLSPDSFDARHIALLKAETEWHRQRANAKADLANSLTEVLLRALNSLEIVAGPLRDLETRKAEREAEAAAVAAAAAEAKARQDAEDRRERERCQWIEGMRAKAIADGTAEDY